MPWLLTAPLSFSSLCSPPPPTTTATTTTTTSTTATATTTATTTTATATATTGEKHRTQRSDQAVALLWASATKKCAAAVAA